MLHKFQGMKSMSLPNPSFPLSEGIGVFVGVVAWDLLVDGRMEIVKAVLISAPFTVAWFGLRCWKEHSKNKRN
jgi:hypothetical protein